MKPLADAPPGDLAHVDFVLTDMDDTLTFDGRLAARTYATLERLQADGVRVIPVTAAPAGWCDQMVRMWPIAAVIGENGGFCFTRRGNTIERRFWGDAGALADTQHRLQEIAARIRAAYPDAVFADDQPFRLTSTAFARPSDHKTASAIVRAFEAAGAHAALNAIWGLGWLGGYDKIAAARRFLPEAVGLDIDADLDRVVFVGDSANDAPMFAHIPKSAGVSTVTEHLADIPKSPAWITRGPGGDGFVEVTDAILAARASRASRTISRIGAVPDRGA
ncbi:MAG: HAD-IIB family hydrolase [Hyphomicrobium sp.]|nr:HAD-IIB family hydrolase [Hyphomicrobium sp.]